MNNREKMLAAAVGGLVVLFLLRMGWNRIDGLYGQRSAQLLALQRAVGDRTLEKKRGEMAAERLHAWQQQSLPADRDVAQTLYNDWLRQRIDDSKFTDVTIHETGATRSRRKTAFEQLAFTVAARGSLEQLTEFLYVFYRADHLHQLRKLEIKPIEDSEKLNLTFAIEALILPGADRTDALSPGTSNRLAKNDPKSYIDSITSRDLFARYVPPSRPRPSRQRPTPPEFDVAGQAIITGITHDESGWQAWVHVKTTDRILRLHAGDPFEVGSLSGTITRIGPREVVFTTDGRQMRVRPGKSLRDATELAQDDT